MSLPTASPHSLRFEPHRDRLFGIAYRMTGSVVDAEDALQEAYVRWQGVDLDAVRNDEAFLVRMVTRLAIDRQRQTARRRESYVGPWLPEPLVGPLTPSRPPDPASAAELADSLSFAFLVMLDRLSAAERAAFLLHDVFGVTFDEIATTLEREPEACRQLASRARRKLRADPSSPERTGHAGTPEPTDRATLDGLLVALLGGDVDGCLAHLAPGVVLTSDAGPNRRAARHHVVGADRVARLLAHLARRAAGNVREIRPVTVNGALGLLFDHVDGPMVITGDIEADGRIGRIWIQMNPDKLVGLLDRGDSPTA
ncbi:MAG: RNA polymerase sigma factor SigJ [Acidimicrobiales bacterium]